MTEKQMRILSVVATLTAVGMYVSYIPQIQNNLAGNPGSPLQPLVAAINCTLWVAYGFLKEKRDYPVGRVCAARHARGGLELQEKWRTRACVPLTPYIRATACLRGNVGYEYLTYEPT